MMKRLGRWLAHLLGLATVDEIDEAQSCFHFLIDQHGQLKEALDMRTTQLAEDSVTMVQLIIDHEICSPQELFARRLRATHFVEQRLAAMRDEEAA